MQAKVKFELIHAAVTKENNVLSVNHLCEIASISRSGYYAWIKAAAHREAREEQDRKDYERILKAYQFRGYAKGARGIYMRLLHTEEGGMNLKKIRRLMKKYGLKCPFRRPNPYRQMQREMRTNATFPNKVNREFFGSGARKVLLTDITYIFYKGGVCYLSTILDAFTREVLAYRLSSNLQVEFVINTVDELVKRHKCELDDTTIVHSDQGCHYTSRAFIKALRENELIQSMSRKGNCWDNAPQESFFGHMKDEIKNEVEKAEAYEEVKGIIDDWMDYYNNDRYQWELGKLSPREYCKYVETGIYPLKNHGATRGSAPHPEV